MTARIAALIFIGSTMLMRADQLVEHVQQALKDQGFYYGEVTGEMNANVAAAIRRYQIRNGLQVSGELNSETLQSLGINSSGSAGPTNLSIQSDDAENFARRRPYWHAIRSCPSRRATQCGALGPDSARPSR